MSGLVTCPACEEYNIDFDSIRLAALWYGFDLVPVAPDFAAEELMKPQGSTETRYRNVDASEIQHRQAGYLRV